MNRRSLFKSMLAGAVLGCTRFLPMPGAPKVESEPEPTSTKALYTDDPRVWMSAYMEAFEHHIWFGVPMELSRQRLLELGFKEAQG